ncbi:hypothetical protein QQY24_30085 [Streptomyces sp. TG1A-8]|uniref:hypothetical protein n=1 Tax=Streptomyces sp. TG1A-8 TaxID=3051385 RepID=UPI00265BBE3F|nr:hypothetical protein [Streptomyces sp. TG1A-8]MDO0929453.1 hypothetical protein [Streptomyces sp. TG1A-8]
MSLVLTLVTGEDHQGEHRTAAGVSGSPGASAPSPGDPAPTGSPSGAPSATDDAVSPSASVSVPAGWEVYEDAERFRIVRPEHWTRSSVDSSYGMAVVNYRSPDKKHRLQVYQVAEASPDASFEQFLSDRTPKPAGFRELDLADLDQDGFTGARPEYLADRVKGEPDVGTWHVYDERFTAADGNIYAIASYGPDGDGRDDELHFLDTALSGFRPPDTNGDGPVD